MNSQKKRERIESSSNNLMSIKENINRLDNNVLLCKKYKEETIKYVKRLKEQHNRGIFTYAEYEYMLNRYLKGYSLKYWVEHYENQEKRIDEKIKSLREQKIIPETVLERPKVFEKKSKSRNFLGYGLAVFIILGVLLGFLFPSSLYDIGSRITGFVTGVENNAPVIEIFTPENDASLQVGGSQVFVITASDTENDNLSIQWYINDLAVGGQVSESFNFTALDAGSFDVKVLVADNQNYTSHRWVLTIIEDTNITLPEENITLPEENVTLPEENITLPEQLNETNITEPVNVTIPEENITEPDQLIQLQAEINKPVKWVRIIKNTKLEPTLRIKIPKEATKIKAKKVTKLITEELKEDISSQKIVIDGVRIPQDYTITGMAVKPVKKESGITSFFKNLFKTTGLATLETETKELVIEETAAKYEISYETPAPLAEEIETETGKKITIYSDISYENISAYITIKGSPREAINFYWIKEEGRILFEDVNYMDTNNDSLIDRLEWIIPHLSNQTFEVELTILNVQSYPQVGGNWTVQFTTKGTANLTIKAVNGTTWSNVNEDNDLKFLEVKCDDELLNYTWVNGSVFIEDYSCNGTGYEISKVLTPGAHSLEFKFGTETGYARNQAAPDCGSGCWYVRDSRNVNLTIFTSANGNLFSKGILTSDIDTGSASAITTVGDGTGHLIFKNSTDDVIAWINNATVGENSRAGDFNLLGTNFTDATCSPVGTDFFKIEDSSGTLQLYLNETGDMCITGTYYDLSSI
ncbi:MAG: hypothetical protein ISS23_03585 [Nanoarchaeota archaeon]|nr:hypothetical protein [Nanoarchaeota archaeon]